MGKDRQSIEYSPDITKFQTGLVDTMYSLRQVKQGLKWSVTRPNLLLREANRLYHRRLYNRDFNTEGIDVMEADWDNLLILDACRYDMFTQQHSLPGRLSERTSRGSHTMEFIKGNFHGRTFPDTVYVTASPILHRGLGEKYDVGFHDTVEVWAVDGWDTHHKTVLPETTTRYALEAAERFPNKRLIVHYMQPHYPFIGYDEFTELVTVPDPDVLESDIWMLFMTGRLDVQPARVWEAYRANLDRVLPHVADLFEELPGKTVLTADHGNMVGERARPLPVREWGHPPGIYTPELVTVPWLEYDSGSRKRIVAGTSRAGSDESVEEDVVDERLRHFGYIQ